MHYNTRSLSANHDNLIPMLSELNHSFPLIGLSETKISYGKDLLVNVNLSGYDFISEPSYADAEGVAFYIKNDFKYIIRTEFTKSTHHFEALWLEIDFHNQPKLLCEIVYRHPNSNLDNYINSTIEHIQQENKLCLFMVDFNIDLLKIDSHADSQLFFNSLGTCFFSNHIFFNQRELLITLLH